MALVDYLDWEVRTTGHDLNCSGFNPARDATNGVDYTQQDNAEITSLNWVVDSTNNTWIRSTELTNWVNSGKTLTSLKGNHIHIAGKAIGGNTLFQWNASTAVSGAYYLQALGGGNPNWTAKPTRFWMNKTFVLENTSLPSGVNSWTYGDKDSLGYSTIYVRFGAESDANPNSKAQDDIIADGQTWTRGAYEIINVGTDGNGPYLVLDRSPGAAGSTAGYGRIGGAMASPGGVASVGAPKANAILRTGTYYLTPNRNQPGGPAGGSVTVLGSSYSSKYNEPGQSERPVIYLYFSSLNQSIFWYCELYELASSTSSGGRSPVFIACNIYNSKHGGMAVSARQCCFFNCYALSGTLDYCYVKNSSIDYGRIQGSYTILHNQTSYDNRASFGTYYGGGNCFNCVVYMSASNGFSSNYDPRSLGIWDSCVAIGCARHGFALENYGGGYYAEGDRRQRIRRCFYYNCTLGGTNSQLGGAGHVTLLPGNPFRDPDNGDFRLADNEAGRMLKQAGFQIPGPQGAPPMKFDVGAVQNSFYDIASGGAFVLPPRTIGA